MVLKLAGKLIKNEHRVTAVREAMFQSVVIIPIVYKKIVVPTIAEGQLKCRCYAGYFEARSEVNTCHGYCRNSGVCSLNENSEPVCQCRGGYEGDGCDVSECHNYCFQRDCSSSAEGLSCRCSPGYTGARCEVYACQGYCRNNGVCSLSENSEPLCQCTGDYESARCDVPAFLIKYFQIYILNADVSSVTRGIGSGVDVCFYCCLKKQRWFGMSTRCEAVAATAQWNKV